MKPKPLANIDDPRYIKAMGHPIRVRLLAMLAERTASPRELAERLGMSLGVIAYHVRTLYELGLLELVEETRVRGAVQHHYRARERPRVSDEAWGQATQIAKQAAVGSTLQIIDEYSRASAAQGGFDRADAHISRTSMRLDQKGWDQAAKAYLKLLEQLQRIEASAEQRVSKDPHAEDITNASLVLMLFESVRLSDQQPDPDTTTRRTPTRSRRGGGRAVAS